MDALDSYWPGKKFGLPEQGPRSTPGWNKRIAGLAIDWAIAMAIGFLFFNYNSLAILATFILIHIIGGLILGGSPGHLLLGIRIAPVAGGRLGLVAPLVRPLLIALVIPPLMNDEDNRGAHDRLVGTILVTR